MHQAQSYLSTTVVPTLPQVKGAVVTLNAAFAAGLSPRLRQDALGYSYSGGISIAEAIRGIDAGMFTWATVKLYYATFYLIRALLAVKGVCIFYVGRTPYSIDALAGRSARKLSGNTHNVVLAEFSARPVFPVFVSQQIGVQDPLDWLRERREAANYGEPKFSEPGPPDHFRHISTWGMRKALEAYSQDATKLYAFDEDHAMVAYPIELLKQLLLEIPNLGPQYDLSSSDRGYLAGLYKDVKGPMAFINRLLIK